ncbi:MAG: LuxR C-terminal-related transcriptional regulator [Microcoleaceae cyanobacterium]
MVILKSLFISITQSKNEQELKVKISTKFRDYFSATRGGIFFFDQITEVNSNLQKVFQTALSPEHNPIVRYLIERHAPIHDALVISPKAWKLICPRADHRHVMVGPIVSNGELVGAVGFTRTQGMPAFNQQNLVDLSALCLHLSTWVVTVHSQSVSDDISLSQLPGIDCLTPREIQIAEWVAFGKTNAEVGAELWITENSVKQALKRIFRKLKVSSRTEMVTRLFVRQSHFLEEHQQL